MDVLDFITLLIILAAFFLLINVKYLKLPSTIGLMIMALSLSLFIIFGEVIFRTLKELANQLMNEYNFSEVLFKVMLSFLLFAGALELDLRKLGEEKWVIFILATMGVLISTFVVGYAMFFLLPFIGIHLDLIYCLLFGGLISPTDPIAVLAMIKKSTVSKNLEAQIAGESLFNDGIGVVVFLTILHIAQAGVGEHINPWSVGLLFGQEVVGGIGLGAIFGFLGLRLLILIENEYTEIEVLVTLSMVLGGASIAEMLHVSGPLAMVTMGLFVGNKGRSSELEKAAGEYVYKFWHLMDEAMNAILFILIGMQIIVIPWSLDYILAAVFAIIIVLVSRVIGVGIPISLYRIKNHIAKYTIRILTWSGLRGGISVALALSLYEYTKTSGGMSRDTVNLIIIMTYCVVLFSIVVQGLTVKKLFEKAANYEASQEANSSASKE
ncbi:MAG: sodium:proton antiporter [Cyclobacteriaceae bacterium]|nr:sodium:proton antiporter [Cyclobacteriaceae bacterium]